MVQNYNARLLPNPVYVRYLRFTGQTGRKVGIKAE